MPSEGPSLDLSALLKKVTEDTTTLPLQLTTWQQEYKERLGLSSSSSSEPTTTTTITRNDTTTDTTTSDTVLPLHPEPLGLEIDHYQDRLNEIKSQYIQLATRHHFIMAILQDPPRQVQPDQVKEMDTEVLKQHRELTNLLKEISRLKLAIAEGNATNEIARQELNETTDSMIQMIDDIEGQKRTLSSLSSLDQYDITKRTPEEAQTLLEEQIQTLANTNKGTDKKREAIMEMEWQIEDKLQELQSLEATYRQAEARAKEAVEKSGQRDLKLEHQAAWYTEMTRMCHSMYGIQKMLVEIDLVQVHYTTGYLLSIHVDPLTGLVTDLEVNNSIDISDLTTLAEGKHIKDIGSTVVIETLARTRLES